MRASEVTDEGPRSGGFVTAVRSHPVVILTAVLAAFLGSLLIVSLRSSKYSTSAQILVTPLTSDAPDPRLPVVRESGDPTRTVQTAANLLDSDEAAAAAAAHLGRGWTRQRVRQSVSVQPEGQSDVIAITAETGDPASAARVANAYATAALDVRRRSLRPIVASLIADTERALRAQPDPHSTVAEDLAARLADLRGLQGGVDPTLSLSRPAAPPAGPSGAPGWLLVVLALMAGTAVGVGCALVLETFLPPRVADATQATAITGLPVLARLPALPSKGRDGQFPVRLEPEAAAAFRAVDAQFELDHGGRRVLLIASPSSHDPPANAAAGFGVALAEVGYDVLLIDLHPVGTSGPTARGAAQPRSLEVALSSSWRDTVSQPPQTPGLSLLAIEEPKSAEALESAARDVRQLLGQARSTFDYVLVDAPPLDQPEAALRVLAAVDGVLLVIHLGRTVVSELEMALELLSRTRGDADGLLVAQAGRRRPPWSLPPRAASRVRAPGTRARDAERRAARGTAPIIPD